MRSSPGSGASFVQSLGSIMGKYIIVVVVGILYATIACWIVQSEGAAYRASLKAAARPEAKPTEVVDRAPIPEPRTKLPAETPRPEKEPDRVAPPPAAEPAPRAIPPPVAERPAAPKPAIKPDRWADHLDLDHLSPEDEMRLGREIHDEILASGYSELHDGPWLERIKGVTDPILESRARKEIEYQFRVLDSDAVAAFSTPGGYIYVCRGLFKMIGDDEDYALETVVGHEIAHVDLRHALRFVAPKNEVAKKNGVGTVTQFLLPIIGGYSNDSFEFDADAWIYRWQRSKGDRSPHEALAFLRRFQKLAEKEGFRDGHRPPTAGSRLLLNHFAAHPAPSDRLRRLQAPAASPKR